MNSLVWCSACKKYRKEHAWRKWRGLNGIWFYASTSWTRPYDALFPETTQNFYEVDFTSDRFRTNPNFHDRELDLAYYVVQRAEKERMTRNIAEAFDVPINLLSSIYDVPGSYQLSKAYADEAIKYYQAQMEHYINSLGLGLVNFPYKLTYSPIIPTEGEEE